MKLNERDYQHKLLCQVNSEASPFRDDDKRDSALTREMLDLYRTSVSLKENSTARGVHRDPAKVHSFLKTLEMGATDPDSKILEHVHNGDLKMTDKPMHDYLVKKLNEVPHACN